MNTIDLKYILIFILAFISKLNSQNEYAYLIETKITGYLHANNNSLNISTDKGNVGSTSYFANNSNVGSTYYDFFYLQNNFNKINIKVDNYAIQIASFPDCTYERQREINRADFGKSYLNFSGCSFSQRLYSLHVYDDEDARNNGICFSNNVTLKYGYHWQFKLGAGGWNDFPTEFNNRVTTTFNFEELLTKSGINLATISANTVQFRTGFNNQFTNIVTYSIISCSPEFKGIVTKSPTCNNFEDGSLELKLGRDIETNEKLAVTLFREDITSGDFTIIPSNGQKFNITSLVGNTDGTFSYFWPAELPAGKYKLKYQTVNSATTVSPSSFDSLNFTGAPFIINSIAPVNFSITNSSNEKCFTVKDGYIDVSATREPGRNLFFQLTKDGTVQVFNGTNWVNYTGTNPNDSGYNPFTNETTTRINKLSKGDYRIKVRDSEKCYMK
ncbi:hypothetical protein [Tenacibaculum sp. 190524A05c]|uniref:hypothetical protein n=1 Tax=Tenacibaculum platacis TaxID=3137852 RepID=UPI0032B13868